MVLIPHAGEEWNQDHRSTHALRGRRKIRHHWRLLPPLPWGVTILLLRLLL